MVYVGRGLNRHGGGATASSAVGRVFDPRSVKPNTLKMIDQIL